MSGISEDLVNSIIEHESSGDPFAMSKTGAAGLMQLEPATARELGVTNRFDPEQNKKGGTKYIGQLMDKYKDPETALIAYNWGPGNVDKHGVEKAPQESRNYAKKVLAKAGASTKEKKMPSIDEFLDAEDDGKTSRKASPIDEFLDAPVGKKKEQEPKQEAKKGVVKNPFDDQYSDEEYAKPEDKNLSPQAARLERLARKAGREGSGLGAVAKGVGELGLSAATGLLSSAAGGIAGLGKAAYSLASGEGLDTAYKKGAETIQKVQRAGTYQPRSTVGKAFSEIAGEIGGIPSKMGGEAGGAIGQAVGGEKGRIAGEAIGEAAPSLIPAAQGLRGALKAGTKEIPVQTPTRRQQVAAQSQDLGYTIPPSQARPTLLNKLLEGVSGKIKTGQGASELNQPITQKIIKEDLGIPENVEFNKEAINTVRNQAGKSYENLKNYDKDFVTTKEYMSAINSLGGVTERLAKKFPELASSDKLDELKNSLKVDQMTPVEAVELSKLLREKASDLLSPTASGESKALGRAYRAANDALEQMIEKNLDQSGNKELLNQYRNARQTIAKTYSIEKAMDASGNVDANKLASQLQRDKPLSGGTKKVAEFASEFGKAARTPNQVGSHLPVDALDFLAAMAAGVGSGNIAGVGTVLARPAVRSGILSKAYQNTAASAKRPMLDKSGRVGEVIEQAAPAAVGAAIKPEDEGQ